MSERRGIARAFLCAACLLLAMLGLGCRLAFLHLGTHDDVRASIERARGYRSRLNVSRGRVYDRRENVLALDLPGKAVCAEPRTIVSNKLIHAVSFALADCLSMSADDVFVRLNRPNRMYARICRFVPGHSSDLSRKRGSWYCRRFSRRIRHARSRVDCHP